MRLAGLTALLLGGMIACGRRRSSRADRFAASLFLLGVPLYRCGGLICRFPWPLLLFGLIALCFGGVFKGADGHEGFSPFNAIGLFVWFRAALASLWLHASTECP